MPRRAAILLLGFGRFFNVGAHLYIAASLWDTFAVMTYLIF